MKARLLLGVAVVGIALSLGVLIGLIAPRVWPARGPGVFFNTTAVVRQVQTLNQLVTVKYVIEKVVVLEDVKWFGESRLLLLAHGVVKAGVDLGQLKDEDVWISGKAIRLQLPRAQITDVYLDEKKTQVIERSTGLLRTFDKDFEAEARRQAVDDIQRAARLAGIQKDAKERAMLQLEGLLHQLGFEKVEIVQ